MYTSIILAALLGPGGATASVASGLKWHDSYQSAREAGRRQNKPLAVFIGSGRRGWRAVAEEGGLSQEARKVLAEEYVCLYVDRTRPGGDQLAERFEIPEGAGLVLSTRDGASQAFSHAGSLDADELLTRLNKYANEAVLSATETVSPAPTTSTSAYPPAANSPPVSAAPPAFGGGFGGFGGFGGGGGGC